MHSSSLSGKKIILGITGSIAAYKSALLARLFVKQGAEVKVVMTKAAGHFISPLTLSTLSNNDVEDSLFSDGSWSKHVELGLWADLMIIAPLSANTLGKMANGICDNMLMATYLSAKCPVYFAPAMDLDMWIHPSTQNNIEKLLSYGNKFIPVGEGFLASGLSGKGRMAEPEDIIEFIAEDVTGDLSLKGKRVLVTAGPTYEPIDPVRFIGNHSSGKMGYAITDYLAKCGATVELVTGPSKLTPPDHPSVNVHKVMTGQEMFEITKELFPKMDGGIFAAAVADYTPKVVADEKIKKKTDSFQLEMVKNPDIAKFIGMQIESYNLKT